MPLGQGPGGHLPAQGSPRGGAALRDARAPRPAGRHGRAAAPWRRRCHPFHSLPFPSAAPSFLRRGASSPRRSRPPRLALSSPAEEWILEDFRRRDIFSAVSRPALFGMVRPAGRAGHGSPRTQTPRCGRRHRRARAAGAGEALGPGPARRCPPEEPLTAPCARWEPSRKVPRSRGLGLVGVFEVSFWN